MPTPEDFWYAYNQTRVIRGPRQTLQTFGATTLRFHLVSELMDDPGKVRIRAGRVDSERPVILTPRPDDQLLDGFSPEAREFITMLHARGGLVRIINYGLQFRREAATQEVVNGPLDEVVDRVKGLLELADDPLTSVLVGADELWEVSLLRFMIEYIEQSLPNNVQEIRQRERDELEADFQRAALDPNHVRVLGEKLQRLGLFEKFEDRFYALARRRR